MLDPPFLLCWPVPRYTQTIYLRLSLFFLTCELKRERFLVPTFGLALNYWLGPSVALPSFILTVGLAVFLTFTCLCRPGDLAHLPPFHLFCRAPVVLFFIFFGLKCEPFSACLPHFFPNFSRLTLFCAFLLISGRRSTTPPFISVSPYGPRRGASSFWPVFSTFFRTEATQTAKCFPTPLPHLHPARTNIRHLKSFFF